MNENLFSILAEAREIIEKWRKTTMKQGFVEYQDSQLAANMIQTSF